MSYHGILVGLVAMPPAFTHENSKGGIDPETFYKTEFFDSEKRTGLFHGFRNTLLTHCSQEKIRNPLNKLYQPRPYFVFGNYDLAILSLVDDFSLGNRHFHPLHKYKDLHNPHKYKYQVITGICNEGYTRCFLDSQKKNPWLGIIRLKLNNSLLIGTGYSIIEDIIKKIKEKHKPPEKIIPFFSFDCSEISLVCLSDKLENITNIVSNIRNFQLDDLSPSLKKKLQKKSLLHVYFENNGTDLDVNELRDTHLFTTTSTTIGIDMEYYKKNKSNENLALTTYIDVKPGHYGAFQNALPRNLRRNKLLSCFGNDSLYFQSNTKKEPPSFSLIKSVDIQKHINKVRTVISHKKDHKEAPPEKGCSEHNWTGHKIYLRDKLYKSSKIFNSDCVENLKTEIKKIGISKVVKDRLIRAIRAYNECMTDPHLFSYFVELHGILDHVIRTIGDYSMRSPKEKNLHSIHGIITGALELFEKGFYCRYHQGFRFPELSNFNTEFNSGLQNLLTTFNQMYVSYFNLLSELSRKTPRLLNGKIFEKNSSFITVTGDDNIVSNPLRLKVNAYLLFHPEFFLMSVVKEAFNSILPELKKNEAFQGTAKSCSGGLKKLVSSSNLSDTFTQSIHEFLDKDFIEYYVIDNLMYYYGFNQDYKLYYHWFMGNLVTTPDYFESDGLPSEKQFIKNYFRLLVILLETKEQAKERLNEIIGYPYDSMFSEYVRKYQRDFALLFKETKHKKHNELFPIQIYIHEIRPFPLHFISKFCEIEFGKIRSERIKERNKEVNELSNKYLKELTKNKVIYYDNTLHPTRHLTAISIAYLRLLTCFDKKNIFQAYDRTKFVLMRNEKGESYPKDKIKNILVKDSIFPYLFDPHGGVFVNSFSARKKYFNLRSCLYLSLFDFATKQKLTYFES